MLDQRVERRRGLAVFSIYWQGVAAMRRRLGERALVEEGHDSRTHSSDTEHMDPDTR